MSNTQSETPIFDELKAQLVILSSPDAKLPAVEITADEDTRKDLGSQALAETQPIKRLASLEGWSTTAREVLVTINNAILDGEKTIRGESYLNYATGHIHTGHILNQEASRFLETVRKL